MPSDHSRLRPRQAEVWHQPHSASNPTGALVAEEPLAARVLVRLSAELELDGGLQMCQQGFVLLVRTDPEPNNHVLVFAKSDSAVAAANPSREHRLLIVNLLEVEARMVRVVGEELI